MRPPVHRPGWLQEIPTALGHIGYASASTASVMMVVSSWFLYANLILAQLWSAHQVQRFACYVRPRASFLNFGHRGMFEMKVLRFLLEIVSFS
jgi:hypothetical protein